MWLSQCKDHQLISLKVEWRCAESGDGLVILVNDEVIPVSVGKKTSSHMLMQRNNNAVLLF